MDTAIKEALEGVQRAFHEYKSANDERVAQIKKSGEASAEVVERVIKLEKAMNDGEELAKRFEKLEIDMKSRVQAANEVDALPADQREHMEKFCNFMRNPKDVKAMRELDEASRNLKQVEVATPGLGGYAVPTVLASHIERRVLEISPMRSLVNVQQASTTDFSLLLDMGGATSGWVGEKGARAGTDTPSLEKIKPTFGMLYAYPKATEESMSDMFFNVANWLADSVAEAFAWQEGRAIIAGDGVNKPSGMLHVPPEIDALITDRALGAYQYLKTNAAAGFPTDDTQADPIIDLIYSLPGVYRQNAQFLMNRFTMGTIRKFKDANGDYIWVPGMQSGATSQLMGYNVREMEGIDNIAANAYPVAFGDFKRGYLLTDLVGLRVTPDEVTEPGFVKWYFRKRLGGIAYNHDAVKWLKCEL